VKRRSWRRLLAVAVGLGLVSTVLAGAGYGRTTVPHAKQAGTINVLSLWGGSEKDAFIKVTNAFTKKTGIKVEYETARDFIPAIRTRLAAGNPPDVAIVPRPGYLASLAREGAFKDLSKMGFTSSYMKPRYTSGWTSLGTVNGKLYGVAVKANSKSVVWYRPDQFTKYKLKPAKTWGQLVALTKAFKAKGVTPWGLGCGPGPSSWTLTDWFENIYARTAGPAKYDRLFAGKLKFTDASVINALKMMTTVLNNKYVAGGGVQGALGRTFVSGITQVFGPNAKAQLYMEGGFVGGIALDQVNKKLKPGKTIAFFPWPTVTAKYDSPLIGGGDLAAAFKDNADIRAFLKYLSTPQAGAIWVSTGAVISPNKQVKGSAYPNALARAEAKQVASAKIFRFDGSDLMPGALGDTWGSALQNVLQKPGDAKNIMSDFQKEADKAY
jgi:alpha-glucoside transport system substrate-binding protein